MAKKNKIRTNVTLDKILHEWAVKEEINASGILNECLKGLKSVISECVSANEVKIGLILTKYGKIKWTRWNSNPGPPPCQDMQDSASVSGKEGDIKEKGKTQNFSTLARISVSEYAESIEDEFLAFCKKTGMSTEYKTAGDYLTALKKLDDVFTPADISDYPENHKGKAIPDKGRKGLLKVFKYIETREYKTEFNEIPLEVWRANLRISERATSNMAGRIKDLEDDEVLAARDDLETADLKFYFSLLAYSGARHSHLFKALKEQREIHHAGPDVIYLDVKDLSAGKKYESRFYFPAAIEKQLKSYKPSFNAGYYREHIGAAGAKDRPVNIASLRKWNYTWLLSHNVDSIAADQIQGRVPKGVGAAHYANPLKLGENAYKAHVEELLKTLPPVKE